MAIDTAIPWAIWIAQINSIQKVLYSKLNDWSKCTIEFSLSFYRATQSGNANKKHIVRILFSGHFFDFAIATGMHRITNNPRAEYFREKMSNYSIAINYIYIIWLIKSFLLLARTDPKICVRRQSKNFCKSDKLKTFANQTKSFVAAIIITSTILICNKFSMVQADTLYYISMIKISSFIYYL